MIARRFARGATILCSFLCSSQASFDQVTAAQGYMRQRIKGKIDLAPEDPEAILMTTTPRAAVPESGVGPGWDLEVDETVTSTLETGFYLVAVLLTVGDSTQMTEPLLLELYENPASPAA